MFRKMYLQKKMFKEMSESNTLASKNDTPLPEVWGSYNMHQVHETYVTYIDCFSSP